MVLQNYELRTTTTCGSLFLQLILKHCVCTKLEWYGSTTAVVYRVHTERLLDGLSSYISSVYMAVITTLTDSESFLWEKRGGVVDHNHGGNTSGAQQLIKLKWFMYTVHALPRNEYKKLTRRTNSARPRLLVLLIQSLVWVEIANSVVTSPCAPQFACASIRKRQLFSLGGYIYR